MYTYENYKFKFPTNILKGLFCIQNTLLSVVALQKPPKPPTPLRGAAKSFFGYRLLPLKSALYKTYIQIKYKSSHIYCKEEIGVYAHYAYTPINYMKIEIILFYSVQIYRILYN